jgi:hypothetical protein
VDDPVVVRAEAEVGQLLPVGVRAKLVRRQHVQGAVGWTGEKRKLMAAPVANLAASCTLSTGGGAGRAQQLQREQPKKREERQHFAEEGEGQQECVGQDVGGLLAG